MHQLHASSQASTHASKQARMVSGHVASFAAMHQESQVTPVLGGILSGTHVQMKNCCTMSWPLSWEPLVTYLGQTLLIAANSTLSPATKQPTGKLFWIIFMSLQGS